LERLKRFNVFANLRSVSAVPSMTLGTAETFERLCETLRVSAAPRIMPGTTERFDGFANLNNVSAVPSVTLGRLGETFKRFSRSKGNAWNR